MALFILSYSILIHDAGMLFVSFVAAAVDRRFLKMKEIMKSRISRSLLRYGIVRAQANHTAFTVMGQHWFFLSFTD